MTINRSVGMDISARKVDVVLRVGQEAQSAKVFMQTPAGHQELVRYLLKAQPDRVVLEATGVYYLDVALVLVEAGLPVSVINPKSYKHFAELKLKGCKTDPVDADLLAEFGQVMAPILWCPPSTESQQLRHFGRHINRLVGQRAQAKNRLHALLSTQTTPRALIKDEQGEIASLDRRIERLRQAAQELLMSIPTLQTAFQHFCGATGFGEVSSLSILAELCTLPETLNARQVVKHAGLDVRLYQSGSSVHKPGRISKAGNRYLRVALFYPAMSAIRHDAHAKAFYESLVGRGKKKMQAIVAVMRKYLTGLWACYRSGNIFDSSRLFNISAYP